MTQVTFDLIALLYNALLKITKYITNILLKYIHSTFCYVFDLQAQVADLVTLKARLAASEGEVKDLHTENSGRPIFRG